MSYNIDTWNTKKLENLKIPLASFFKSDRKDWHPDRKNEDDGSVTLRCGESTEIKGTLENGILSVTSIKIRGGCSGTFWNEVMSPALEDSTGELVASRVWERGDSIDRVTVKDGKVTTEKIDI